MIATVNHTHIAGVCELHSSFYCDERGSFLNAFRAQDSVFSQTWNQRNISQINISRTSSVGTVRGLHLQSNPYSEAKLVRCLQGAVWDVAVDLRPGSDTYGRWYATELTSAVGNALFIPEGCAHGFQVLEPNSELLYIHSSPWVPEAEQN